MNIARKIAVRMLVAGLILGAPSAVFARNSDNENGGGGGNGQREMRAALLGLINAATAALNSGACSGDSQIPPLPE